MARHILKGKCPLNAACALIQGYRTPGHVGGPCRMLSSGTGTGNGKLVRVQESEGLRKILLDDPKTRNSLSLTMMQDLIDAIRVNQSNPELRCIAIGAAPGPVFSAGHNLKELTADQGVDKQRTIFAKCSELILEIRKSQVPVIGFVNGFAAAAGCQLIAACDFTICTQASRFSTPGASFGIFCSTPGIDVARKVNQSAAAYMLLTGNAISAEDALRIGLVVKVLPDESALEKELAESYRAIQSKSRSVVKLGREFFYQQIQMQYEDALRHGAAKMVENLGYKDCQNGLESFKKKTKPVWTHASE